MKFSANLGFLWTNLSLPNAIHAAYAAGFDAVKCHWPYDTDASKVRAALADTGLPMLSANTVRGDLSAGDNGLAGLPRRKSEARLAIGQAIDYATNVGVQCVHVMAGFAEGAEAEQTFIENLTYACDKADTHGKTILIEPLNRHVAPGYFLKTTDQAAQLIAQINNQTLKIMFECYYVGRTEGDVIYRMNALKNVIGHIQFASVPARGEPTQGESNYDAVFAAMGWTQALGAEYKPDNDTESSLDWMQKWR